MYFVDEILCTKSIVFYPDGKYYLFFDSKPIINLAVCVKETITSTEDIDMVIQNLTKVTRCKGAIKYEKYPNTKVKCVQKDYTFKTYRHSNCELITLDETGSCLFCKKISIALRVESHRIESLAKSKIHNNTFRDKKLLYQRKRQKMYKLQLRLKKIQNKLKAVQEKYNKLSENIVQEALDKCNVSGTLRGMIEECFKLGKTQNCHGRRYSGDWILTCLLINIKSPATYKFLQVNNILPLPAPTTIRNYLSMVKVKCGLDDAFFKALHTKMKDKQEFQKHGILVFDEIQVRTSLQVNVKNMNYDGIVDFGDTEKKTGDLVLADHALVYMFSSLGEKFNQPVAVYGVKGATKGSTLAKLTLTVIKKLESCGCYVDGIICDGATTNRRMWKEFGVSGELGNTNNKILHPCRHSVPNESRYLYFFSDWIHLVKCIRSRFQQQTILKVGRAHVLHGIPIFYCDFP